MHKLYVLEFSLHLFNSLRWYNISLVIVFVVMERIGGNILSSDEVYKIRRNTETFLEERGGRWRGWKTVRRAIIDCAHDDTTVGTVE